MNIWEETHKWAVQEEARCRLRASEDPKVIRISDYRPTYIEERG